MESSQSGMTMVRLVLTTEGVALRMHEGQQGGGAYAMNHDEWQAPPKVCIRGRRLHALTQKSSYAGMVAR